METHQKQAAKFLISFFSLAVLAISASTSFMFFHTFFDALISPELAGQQVAALISGVIGTLLFDLACVIWLYTFLHHAETPEQRAITLIMTIGTFIGSATASVAHLSLSAGDLALVGEARATISLLSVVVVIVGVVANFGAAQAYSRFSYENKRKVHEANQRDIVQQAQDEQESLLTQLTGQHVRELITAEAPRLAEMQAAQLFAKFNNRQEIKYHNEKSVVQLAAETPAGISDPQIIAVEPKETPSPLA